MNLLRSLASCSILCLGGPVVVAESPNAANDVVWNVDRLDSIGGHRVTVVGTPRVVETERGKAVEFDGVGDALYVAANPTAGLERFTVEVVFRPAADGAKEQRFLHFQPDGGDDRLLFETRLMPEGRWFLDTYVQTAAGKVTLYAEKFLHPLDRWHAATVVVDGRTMRHYVDGKEELAADVGFTPLAVGQTSIGVRFNRVHWFKGAIRQIRVTPRVLQPHEMLRP